jgi:hypothetical protein
MPATLRTPAAAFLMAAPAFAVASAVPIWAEGRLANLTGVVAASVVGIIVYAALQRMWRSPELNSLVAELRRTPSRPATEQAAKQEIAIYRSNRS